MATLKSLLDATIKAGSKFAYPKGNSIVIKTFSTHANDSATWADGYTYTCPSDGVLLTYNSAGENTHIGGTTTGCRVEKVGSFAKNSRYAWVLVSKGNTVNLHAFNQTATTTVSFYPASGQV